MKARVPRQTYLDNGFVYLPGFFDAREITICQEKIREFIEGLVPQLPRDHVFYEDRETLSTLKQTHIRKLLTGPALMPPKAVQLLTLLKATGTVSLPTVFTTINGAPWPAHAKKFAYDLAANAWTVARVACFRIFPAPAGM